MNQPCGCAIDSICEVSVSDLAVALIIGHVRDWILRIDCLRCQCGSLVNEMWKQVYSGLQRRSFRTFHGHPQQRHQKQLVIFLEGGASVEICLMPLATDSNRSRFCKSTVLLMKLVNYVLCLP